MMIKKKLLMKIAKKNNLQIDFNEKDESYLKIIILKIILKNIHYQIKNFSSLKKLPKINLYFLSKRK